MLFSCKTPTSWGADQFPLLPDGGWIIVHSYRMSSPLLSPGTRSDRLRCQRLNVVPPFVSGEVCFETLFLCSVFRIVHLTPKYSQIANIRKLFQIFPNSEHRIPNNPNIRKYAQHANQGQTSDRPHCVGESRIDCKGASPRPHRWFAAP